MNVAPGSFRDPNGHVYEDKDAVYRTIDALYSKHWERAVSFIETMASEGSILPFEEVPPIHGAWKTIKAERLPFISYPYEWSFEQLKDAACLTLRLQRQALAHGLILKDSSAYNIQFKGTRPVFIDHLSFETWEKGKPWVAYRQFCSHFIAPLALSASVDLRSGLLSKIWIDGIPLDMAAAMMPFKRRFNPGLFFHLFLHARLQGLYSDTRKHADKAKRANFSASYLIGLSESLERLIAAMRLPKTTTEWGDYYNDTNYTDEAAEQKLAIVSRVAGHVGGSALAVDLGANTGLYTREIAPFFANVLSIDIDPLAVNRHYAYLKKNSTSPRNILPLVMDLSNPSSSIGFNCAERLSFSKRCSARLIIALALVHHLRITAGIPLHLQAEFFASLLEENGLLLLEFVPKEDSQTQRLLSLREDVFADYSLETCLAIFTNHFECLEVTPIKESKRHMLLLAKK